MEYYIVQPDGLHFPVGPSDEVDLLQVMDSLRATVPLRGWTSLDLSILADDPYGEAAKVTASLADLMDFNATGIHVLSERCKVELTPFLGGGCELLPVTVAGKSYYLNHVMTVLDALELTASEIERFESGNIKSVGKYVLKRDVAARADIFRLAGIRWHTVIASGRVREAVQDRALSGFSFLPIAVV